ncbi:unnamed protein product [Amoebophrya sp. A120]|nr:unnamed protein product [Amoebophrya sp. A120]|eukprot:GSA120T00004677001.1
MLAALAKNPVVEVMAGTSSLPYVWEVMTFLFLAQVAETVVLLSEATTLVGKAADLLRIAVRAFGGVHIVLPFILGSFPSVLLNELDRYAGIFVAVVVIFVLLGSYVPDRVMNALNYPKQLGYAIFVSNICVSGTMQGMAAFPDSECAPVLLGFLAVCGGYLLEMGVTAKFFKKDYSSDQLLALFGPVLFMQLTTNSRLLLAEPLARAMVFVFRLSCEVIDYNEILAYVNYLRIKVLQKVATAIGYP